MVAAYKAERAVRASVALVEPADAQAARPEDSVELVVAAAVVVVFRDRPAHREVDAEVGVDAAVLEAVLEVVLEVQEAVAAKWCGTQSSVP